MAKTEACVQELTREELEERFLSFYGKARHKVSDRAAHKAGEDVIRALIKERGL